MKQKNILFSQLQPKLFIRIIAQRKGKTAERAELLGMWRHKVQLLVRRGSHFYPICSQETATPKHKARTLLKTKDKATKKKKCTGFKFRQFVSHQKER